MKIHKIDNREIRSFRLQQKNLELQKFFADKNNIGTFMMTDPLQPEDRKNLRKESKEHSLLIKTIQKKIIKLWIKTNKWNKITNLLAGNVVKITPKNKKNFNKKTLIYIFKHEQFYLRVLNWDHQLYRNTHILNFVNIENFELKNPILSLMHFLIRNTLIMEKLMQKVNPQ